MEGHRLILNRDINQRVTIENGTAGLAEGFVWCFFDGYTMDQATKIFMNSGNTDQIVFQYGDMQDVYNGYTDFRSISRDMSGRISVCMAKGDDEDGL